MYYFIVSYAQILGFCKKKNFDRASIGGDTIIPRGFSGDKNPTTKGILKKKKSKKSPCLFKNDVAELVGTCNVVEAGTQFEL